MNRSYEHHFTWMDRINPGGYALISESPEVDTAVVFVHGFLGDAEGTWLNFQGMIDSLHAKYPRLAKCDIFFFAYPSFSQDITESGEEFLAFVSAIYPKPPNWLFSISEPFLGIPPSVLHLGLPQHTYKNLIMVGHSEGCIVVRRAVDIAYKADQQHVILSSGMLHFFAPAHLGYQPTGWIRACLAVGRVEAILLPSPAFTEMQKKDLLNQIQKDTEIFWNESKLAVMRAYVLFGKERIVVKGEFTHDILEPSEPGKNHVSICKPGVDYERPIHFIFKWR